MKTLALLFLFPLVSNACPALPNIFGSWKSAASTMVIRNNGSDAIQVKCNAVEVKIQQTSGGFQISKCVITDCDDASTFLCDIPALTVAADKILNSNGEKVGSCTDKVILQIDMDSMSWKDWTFAPTSQGLQMGLQYSYWNLGTIESQPILLTK